MQTRRDQIVRDVNMECEDGRLEWNYDTVYSIIQDYPLNGDMDFTVELQDDEDPRPNPGSPLGREADDDMDEDTVLPIDHPPRDRGDGPGAPLLDKSQRIQLAGAEDRITRYDTLVTLLDREQDPDLVRFIEMKKHNVERHLRTAGRQPADSHLAQALMSRLRNDEQKLLAERAILKRQYDSEQKQKAAERAAKQARLELDNTRRTIQGEITFFEEPKSYTAEMFGAGIKSGGGKQGRGCRFELMHRIQAKSQLTGAQTNDWQLFLHQWDAILLEEYGANWGS